MNVMFGKTMAALIYPQEEGHSCLVINLNFGVDDNSVSKCLYMCLKCKCLKK